VSLGHCCFSGCTPRACGCCVRMIFHEDDCPERADLSRRTRERMERLGIPAGTDDPGLIALGAKPRTRHRNAVGRALFLAGSALRAAGDRLCWLAGWWDAGTDE